MRGLTAPPPCRRNTRAERRVSLMLFVTALTFLVLTGPISVSHVIHTLLFEETVNLLNQNVFMTMFAIADLLAYAQHASQFYVCFACSFCFRQALRRQLMRFATRIRQSLSFKKMAEPMPLIRLVGRFELRRHSRVPPVHYFQWYIQQEQQLER